MVKSLRESEVKEILDFIDGTVKDVTKSKKAKKDTSLSVSSISRASKDLIMSFPVLCDNSLDPKTAAMICKAVERKAVSMLQILFASNTFKANNGAEIIKDWHNNLKGDFSLDDYLDLCDTFSESCDSPEDKRLIREATEQIRIEMRNGCKSYPISSVSENSINDFRLIVKNGNMIVNEASHILNEAPKPPMPPARYYGDKKHYQSDMDNFNTDTQDFKNRMEYQKYKDEKRQAGADFHQKQMNSDREFMQRQTTNDTAFFKQQLMDNDVKKCNELVPSLMIVKFNSPVGDGGAIVTNQFVAGVKARLISVDSYDVIDRIQTKNKDKAGLLKFIKATTKEISFVKDYLLAIDKAKLDAKNNSIKNKSASIWKTLEKRSTKSVWNRLNRNVNDAACITTLVISQEIANVLKKEYDCDLSNVKVASSIMDAYNLLALVIVDESTEVARFLYDGDSSYEAMSFNSLERESGDGSYKKVINLLSKMNR